LKTDVDHRLRIGYTSGREDTTMRAHPFIPLCVLLAAAPLLAWSQESTSDINLPKPRTKGTVSLEAAIAGRSTGRQFKAKPLAVAELSQLLWAAGGVLPADAVSGATAKVTPSAGGLYPLEIYVVIGKSAVDGVGEGVYHYDPVSNLIKRIAAGDKRLDIVAAAPGNAWMRKAPAIVVIAGVFSRSMMKYGDRGVNYTFMEAGNANQNLCLQATALGLQSATVGAFQDEQISQALGLPSKTAPLLLTAVGK
jgi:SagB-type dehydrogenase family enzyme